MKSKLPLSEKKFNNSKLLLFSTVLTITAIFITIFTILNNPTTSFLVISLLILILVLSLSQPFPYSNWVSLFFSIGFLGVAHYRYFGLSQNFYLLTGYAVVGYFLTAWLCGVCLQQYIIYRSNQLKTIKLLENLQVFDQSTKLMRWPFARQSLINEIKRSRRYNSSVTLLLLDLNEKDLLDPNEIERMNQSLAEGLVNNCRTGIDIPFAMCSIGIYLPETNEKNANIFAWRLINTFLTDYQLQVSVGLATFPSDGITVEELVEYALIALRFGLVNNKAVVSYSNLATNGTKPTDESLEEGTIDQGDESGLDKGMIDEIIDNTSLQENEWFVCIEGFESLDELEKLNADIGQQEGVRLLDLSDNHLLIIINTEVEQAKNFVFSSFTLALSEVDNEKRVVKLIPKDSKTEEN